jgi:pimeloyl-ACP methyl ester carboxylesterase
MAKLKLLALHVLFATSTAWSAGGKAPAPENPSPGPEQPVSGGKMGTCGPSEGCAQNGEYFYNLAGSKGVVVCLHGSGGSARAWGEAKNHSGKSSFLAALLAKGYGFVCPSSIDRGGKSWDSSDAATNSDVRNVDAILRKLGLTNARLFIVGHSNGGGFASRYALLSENTKRVAAVQLSNAAGIVAMLRQAAYVFPTKFNYARCDQTVNSSRVEKSADILRTRRIPYQIEELSAKYDPALGCHDFLDTSSSTAAFFGGS